MLRLFMPLLWLWQCPQCLLGLCLWCLLKGMGKSLEYREGVWVCPWLFGAGGVCLGEFIFILDTEDHAIARGHELGHRVQSRLLGPLYLFVVGLPSACMNLAARRFVHLQKTYYQRFPENWADKLGKIQRKS